MTNTNPDDPDPIDPLAGVTEQKLATLVATLRPGWTTDDIRRSVQDQRVRQWPPQVQAVAAIRNATDPTSEHPGRLAHRSPTWWAECARLVGAPTTTPTPASYTATHTPRPTAEQLEQRRARVRREMAAAAGRDLMEHPDPMETSE